MKQIIFERQIFDILSESANGKVFSILDFLVRKAEETNNEIVMTYDGITEALHFGHTTVGECMRMLMRAGIIERISAGKYKINNNIIRTREINEVL